MSTTRRGFLAALGGGCVLAALGCSNQPLIQQIGLSAPDGPVAPILASKRDRLRHVLDRCSFGVTPDDRAAALALPLDQGADPDAAADAWLARQLAPEGIDEDPRLRWKLRGLTALGEPAGELYEYRADALRHELVAATLLRACYSRRQLHEVMVEFWSDHFSIDLSKGDCAWLKLADDRQTVRAHALGRFPELLRASVMSPAMLWYLDGRMNRAGPGLRPNENHARELLELHTLGVDGGYTQGDVMEVARCLSGWTVRPQDGWRKGAVEYSGEHHDDGAKTVLGQAIPAGLGAGDLDRVLHVVCAHPATARHLARKLCARFIADDPPAAAVAAVAASYGASNGDLRAMLATLFARDEFRDPAVFAGKLKRPVHYLVSVLRACAADSDGGPVLHQHLAAMGQLPFHHPTPDGYPVGASAWRDALLPRWLFALAAASGLGSSGAIDAVDLERRCGGSGGTIAHLLGRAARPAELDAWREAGGGAAALGLLLASPGFQRC